MRLLPLLLLTAGCAENLGGERAFDGPDGRAVLTPEEGGPFESPVGFVANTRSGTIVPIDLKHNVLLGDQYGAPFLRPRWVATGDDRQLGQIAVWASEDDQVSVFAADLAWDVLVEAPYLLGFDGEPQVVEPAAGDPVFVDADASGDDASLADLTLRTGFTTTETWELSFDGEAWWVTGSRSGKQASQAKTGESFKTDRGELEFTIEGTATEGDRIELATDTGIVEHDLGGTPLAVQRVPGEDLLVVGVWDGTVGGGFLSVFDPSEGAVVDEIALPEGAQPWRLAFGADAGALYVADARNAAAYLVDFDVASPGSSAIRSLETAAPVQDITWVGRDDDAGLQRTSFSHLAVALAGIDRIDLYDLDTDTWIDTNPLDDVVGGIDLHRPIVGISASQSAVPLQVETNWGAVDEKPVIAVTTFDGAFQALDGETGCMLTDPGGPRVTLSSGVEQIDTNDRSPASTTDLAINEETGRRVSTTNCGGVLRAESWTVTYDQIDDSWEVEGTLSGVQQSRAIENVRYVTDQGELSFTILTGNAPSTDGDNFTFTTDAAVLRIEGVRNSGGGTDPMELPAAPLVFEFVAGPTGGGWDDLKRYSYALVPVTNSDWVLRIRLDSFSTEVVWN